MVGPLSSAVTYTLTCEAGSESLIVVTSIAVTAGGLTVTWRAPTENTDGSPLTDLAAFKIYAGKRPGKYNKVFDVADPEATSYNVPLDPGDYRVVMTAIDADGNESEFSNEEVLTAF